MVAFKIYLVGGAVRDKLLGLPIKEKDWVVVGASPDELLKQNYQQVGKDFPVFLHPETKEEYALARTERKTAPGYTGFEFNSALNITLAEDLLRRDLTINAIAEDQQGRLIDPYHGQADLQDKILRHVSPAFVEDPVRILRVARFMARFAHLGFSVAATTYHLMRTMVNNGEVDALVAERVWQEWQQSLTEQDPAIFFQVLNDCGALSILFPEISRHYQTSLDNLTAAAKLSTVAKIRFAALMQALTVAESETVAKRFAVPKEFQQLALLIKKNLPMLVDHHDAENHVTLLENLDYFRRPQRLADFLLIAQILGVEMAILDKLRRAALCATQITARSLVDTGLSGKALGQAIHLERVKQLKNCL